MAVAGRLTRIVGRLLVVFAAGSGTVFGFGAVSMPVPGDFTGKKELQPISLQLKWEHSFQFAGYYAAVHKGFYREAGLDVELRVPSGDEDSISQVLKGVATYGIGSSDLLLYRAQGVPVVVLAAIFQHSPVVILTLKESGYDSLRKLRGKRFMSTRKHFHLVLDLMFQKAGLTMDDIECVPHTRNIQDLLEGRVDAMSAYWINYPFYLDRHPVEYNVFFPHDYGVDIYNDCLFTLENEARRHPARVRAFRKASLRGWQYALDHPGEIIDVILSEYDASLSRAKLEFQAGAIRDLMAPELFEIGYMHAGRWREISKQMVAGGLLTPEEKDKISFSRFLYNPRLGRHNEVLLWWLAGGVFLLSLCSGVFMTGNLWLRNKVKRRTVELQESETNFRKLVQGSLDGIVVTNEQGGILYANDSFFKVTGATLSPGESGLSDNPGRRGGQMQDWMDVSEYNRLIRHTRTRKKSSRKFYEVSLRNHAGREIPIEACASDIRWENKVAHLIQFRDFSWRKRLHEDVLNTVTQEKQSLGVELHDGLAQHMAAAAYLSRKFDSKENPESEGWRETVAEIQELLQKCLHQIRDLAHGINTFDVEDRKIEKTVRRMAWRSERVFNIHCDVNGCGKPLEVTDEKVAGHIYFILQEAIANAVRHGKARSIRIDLDGVDGTGLLRRITIQDDGVGFDVENPNGDGMGLHILQYRAEMINAVVRIDSVVGRGTTVTCQLPEPTETNRRCIS